MISEDVSATHKTLRPILVAVNAIHAKSGGGITYLRNVLPILAENQSVKLHLFIHKDQFELFYPIHENKLAEILEDKLPTKLSNFFIL